MTDNNRGSQRPLLKPIPERIKEAREARGFTLETFSQALEITPQAVAQFETGVISPSGETISKIIALTAQPPSFFTNAALRPHDPGVAFWRSLKRMETNHRRRIYRRLGWAADISTYISEFIHLPPVDLPQIEFDYETSDNEQIELAAEVVRDHWGLGRGPIENLVSCLEEHGIVIIHEPVSCNDMDAVSCWVGGKPFIILSSEVQSGPRCLFNLAHELGHLVLHAGIEINDKNLKSIEKQANRFAGAFLLPRGRFSQEVLGTSLKYFESLKARWKVAISAMIYRCNDLGVFTENQFSYLMRQMNIAGIRKVEPLDDIIKIEKPSILGDSINMLLEHRVQTKAQIEDRLNLNLSDVESLCGLEEGFLYSKIVPLQFKGRNVSNDK